MLIVGVQFFWDTVYNSCAVMLVIRAFKFFFVTYLRSFLRPCLPLPKVPANQSVGRGAGVVQWLMPSPMRTRLSREFTRNAGRDPTTARFQIFCWEWYVMYVRRQISRRQNDADGRLERDRQLLRLKSNSLVVRKHTRKRYMPPDKLLFFFSYFLVRPSVGR